MADLPPLAANAVRDLLTANIKRPDGSDATAFSQQRDGLVAMRDKVLELDSRVAALEARQPGPFFP